MNRVKVVGQKKNHKVTLYTLSTCVWCKKTKQLLKDNKIEYEYFDLDTMDPQDRQEAMNDIQARGLRVSVPIMIIDDNQVITGYKEDSIREALGI